MVKITLNIEDVIRGGRAWVVEQMQASGMRQFPYSWRSDGQNLIIEGVAA